MVLLKERMRGVQEQAMRAIDVRTFDPPEVIFGLAELVGRLIVKSVKGTWLEKKEVMDEVCKHIERTIKAGLEAEGNGRNIN